VEIISVFVQDSESRLSVTDITKARMEKAVVGFLKRKTRIDGV
jgi:hypothetical protein